MCEWRMNVDHHVSGDCGWDGMIVGKTGRGVECCFAIRRAAVVDEGGGELPLWMG